MRGGEQRARDPKTRIGITKSKRRRSRGYQSAMHAYRQLSVLLTEQGMSDEAAYFSYRERLLHRKVLWLFIQWGNLERQQDGLFQLTLMQKLPELLQRVQKFGSFIFSFFLDILAGYGYRPGRTVIWYLYASR
jgi:hypothetical protein